MISRTRDLDASRLRLDRAITSSPVVDRGVVYVGSTGRQAVRDRVGVHMALTWIREGTPVWDATNAVDSGRRASGALEPPELRSAIWRRVSGSAVEEDGRPPATAGWTAPGVTRDHPGRRPAQTGRRGLGELHHPPARKRSAWRGASTTLQRGAADPPDRVRSIGVASKAPAGLQPSGDGLAQRGGKASSADYHPVI